MEINRRKEPWVGWVDWGKRVLVLTKGVCCSYKGFQVASLSKEPPRMHENKLTVELMSSATKGQR